MTFTIPEVLGGLVVAWVVIVLIAWWRDDWPEDHGR